MAAVQDLFLEINDVLSNDIQSAFKCGICMSTMKDPWLTACNHPFCKSCLFACFGKTTRIECPMCRQPVSKRGCCPSEQIAQLVEVYLKMAGRFKAEVKGHVLEIPPERRFLESQAVTQMPSPQTFAAPNPKKRPRVEEELPMKKKMAREEVEQSLKASDAFGGEVKKPQIEEEPKKEEAIPKRENVVSTSGQGGSRILPIVEKVNQRRSSLQEEGEPRLEVSGRRSKRSESLDVPVATAVVGQMPPKKSGPGEDQKTMELKKKKEDVKRASGQGGSGAVRDSLDKMTPKRTRFSSDTEGYDFRKELEETVKNGGCIYSNYYGLTPTVKNASDAFGGEVKKAQIEEEAKKEETIQKGEKVATTSGQGGSRILPVTEKQSSTLREEEKNNDSTNTTPRKQILPVRPEFADNKDPDAMTPEERQKFFSGYRGKTVLPRRFPFSKLPQKETAAKRKCLEWDEVQGGQKEVKENVASDKFTAITEEDLRKAIERKKAAIPGCSNIDALFSIIPGLKNILAENLSDLAQALPVLAKASSTQKKLTNDDVPSVVVLGSTDGAVSAAEQDKENSTIELSGDEGEEEDEANITLNMTINGEEEETGLAPDNVIVPVIKKPYGFVPNEEVEKMVIAVSRVETVEDQFLVQKFVAAFPQLTMIVEVDHGCTHLVMMNTDEQNHCTNRSLRFVFAVARGCEIVGRKWIEECLVEKRILLTDEFSVRVDNKEDRKRFKLKAGPTPWREARLRPKLFTDRKFYVPTSFCDSKAVPRENVVELIQLCGGEVISKLWELVPPKDCAIIFKPCSTAADEARRYETDTKVPVYTVDYILDAIANFELPFSTVHYRVVRRPH